MLSAASAQCIIGHIIYNVEQTQYASQEEHSQTQHHIPYIQQRIQAMTVVSQPANHRCHAIGDVNLVDQEVRTVEECCNGTTQQNGTQNTIDDQAPLESLHS